MGRCKNMGFLWKAVEMTIRFFIFINVILHHFSSTRDWLNHKPPDSGNSLYLIRFLAVLSGCRCSVFRSYTLCGKSSSRISKEFVFKWCSSITKLPDVVCAYTTKCITSVPRHIQSFLQPQLIFQSLHGARERSHYGAPSKNPTVHSSWWRKIGHRGPKQH